MSFSENSKVTFKDEFCLPNLPSEMIVKRVVLPLGEEVVVFWFDENSTYMEQTFRSEMLETLETDLPSYNSYNSDFEDEESGPGSTVF